MQKIIKSILFLALAFNLSAQENFILEEDFNDSSIDPAIVFSPDLEGFDGRVEVVSGQGINNSPGVMIGKYEDSGLTRNGLDIHLAIADSTDVFVQFFIRDFVDENHFEDGLFLSNNGGVTFTKVYSFKPLEWCDNIWGQFPAFKLDDLGVAFSNDFVVRIQQYDNADFNTSGDEDGFIVDNIAVYTKHPSYSDLPFRDDFNDGFLKKNWNWSDPDKTMSPLAGTAKPTGFVGVVDAVGINGTPGVQIGKRCDDGLTANALDLHLNLAGLSDVYFSFSIRDFVEENHNQDGLFFSSDGGNSFRQVYTFKEADWCDNTWGAFPPFHIDAMAASVGLSLTSTFIIRIQQYDNADFNTSGDEDGIFIDDILVEQRPPLYATLPFTDDFDSSNNGALGQSWKWSHGDSTVAPLEYQVKPTGFVGIVDAAGTNGTPGVQIGKRCDDGLTVNALDLHLNLAGLSDVYFSFSIRDFVEENHNQDGLFFSSDGGNSFHQVYTFKEADWCDNTWGAFPPFYIDAMAASVGLSLTSTFIIRIQQYDNADFNTSGDEDGIFIDDVLVEQRPPLYATLPFVDDFNSSNNGALGQSWNWSHGDSTVAPLEYQVKPTGFVGIVDAAGTNGTPGVQIGKRCDDGLTVNALDLHLDLQNQRGVVLCFDLLDFLNENHVQDGLYFSNNAGLSFTQIVTFDYVAYPDNQFNGIPISINLDSLANVFGLSYSDQSVIRFQQYDDADFNTSGDEDGIILDNINVKTDVVNALDKPSQLSPQFILFPNPVTGLLNIQSNEEIKKMVILNTKGQVIFEYNEVNRLLKEVDLSALSSGIYFVQIFSENGVGVRKLLKQ